MKSNQAPLFPFKHKMHALADFALQSYRICIQSLTLRQGQTRHWPFFKIQDFLQI